MAGASTIKNDEHSYSKDNASSDLSRVHAATLARFPAGRVLGERYRIERPLARGGMGCVFLATQQPLGRRVAVKVLATAVADQSLRQRFLVEASTCARLVHRHIVIVHDFGETEDGSLYTVMEHLEGDPLSVAISRDVRFDSERACRIGGQICRALVAAHAKGVVHRDLKPSNIMLIREDDNVTDFVKVLDFGLAKIFQKESGRDDLDKTPKGSFLGSPKYMAPEQIRGEAVDARADIYAMGAILFHMLTGRPPFVGANDVEILSQHLRDPVPSITSVLGHSDVAPELELIVERCMQKDPALRYASAQDLFTEVSAAQRLISGFVADDSSLRVLGDGETSSHGVKPAKEVLAAIAAAEARPLTGPPPRYESLERTRAEGTNDLGDSVVAEHRKSTRIKLLGAIAAAGAAGAIALVLLRGGTSDPPRQETWTAEQKIERERLEPKPEQPTLKLIVGNEAAEEQKIVEAPSPVPQAEQEDRAGVAQQEAAREPARARTPVRREVRAAAARPKKVQDAQLRAESAPTEATPAPASEKKKKREREIVGDRFPVLEEAPAIVE